MRTVVKNAALHQPVDLRLLPNGEYSGIWSGQLVHVKINHTQYWMTTKDGVRGKCHCAVIVEDGTVTIRSIRHQA